MITTPITYSRMCTSSADSLPHLPESIFAACRREPTSAGADERASAGPPSSSCYSRRATAGCCRERQEAGVDQAALGEDPANIAVSLAARHKKQGVSRGPREAAGLQSGESPHGSRTASPPESRPPGRDKSPRRGPLSRAPAASGPGLRRGGQLASAPSA